LGGQPSFPIFLHYGGEAMKVSAFSPHRAGAMGGLSGGVVEGSQGSLGLAVQDEK
jgi:hypothetical protein